MTDEPRPAKPGTCLLPLLVLGVILLGLGGATMFLASKKNPLVIHRTSWSTSQGPQDLDAKVVALTASLDAAEVTRRLGAPEAVDSDRDIEHWTYHSESSNGYEERLFGLIRTGGGASSSGRTAWMEFQDGKLVRCSAATHFPALSRVTERRFKRLTGWKRDPGYVLGSGRSAFTGLAGLRNGKSTAKDAFDLLGTPARVRFHENLEACLFDVTIPTMTTATTLGFNIFLRDGVVVDTPVDVCEDEELLKRFDEFWTWPAR